MSFGRENWLHVGGYLVAAAVGAAVLSRYYGIFEHDTDSPGAARDAYLMAVGIAGGVGPAITVSILWLVSCFRK